ATLLQFQLVQPRFLSFARHPLALLLVVLALAAHFVFLRALLFDTFRRRAPQRLGRLMPASGAQITVVADPRPAHLAGVAQAAQAQRQQHAAADGADRGD